MPAAAAPSVLRGWRLQAADGRCWLPAPRAVGRSAAVRGRFPPVVNALLCSERLSWATTGRNPADVLSGLQARSSSWRADPPLVSKQFAVTLKENQLPRATAVSHHLLLRAGFLRQVRGGGGILPTPLRRRWKHASGLPPGPFKSAAGVFAFLPLAVRSLNKIEALIDQEMERLGVTALVSPVGGVQRNACAQLVANVDASGSHKVILPNLSDAEPWKTTGRWETAGSEVCFRSLLSVRALPRERPEGIRFLPGADARGGDNEIGGARPGFLAAAARPAIPNSGTSKGRKFRDEISPTMGLLRAKEFIMADLYSFDATEKEAKCTYDEVVQAFRRLLKLIGVPYKMVRLPAFVERLAGSGNPRPINVASPLRRKQTLARLADRYHTSSM
ncbi:MAG: hypothetical protein BJ554DRAFT_1266, partial [Olpidium bornovanus]